MKLPRRNFLHLVAGAARLIGHWLSERLGQQFIIDNRPGASGNIAMESVVRSPVCTGNLNSSVSVM